LRFAKSSKHSLKECEDPEHPRLAITAHYPSLLKKIIVAVVNFWVNHWQRTIGIIIALGMLFVAILNT
jgi:hypothetical protein